jgi:hypothetical protein
MVARSWWLPGVGGALNKKLKIIAQSSTNKTTIIASTLRKFVEAFSKIEFLKMEVNKETILRMV